MIVQPDTEVPAPRRGGTWLYCQWVERKPGQATTCASEAEGVFLNYSRFRTMRKYRQHWRRFHAGR